MLLSSQCTLCKQYISFFYCYIYIILNTSGVPGLSNFDVNDHFSIQQVDADQTNEEKRLFMEQLLNQIGVVGLIDAQIAQPSPENLLGGANNPLNKFVNSDLLAEERKRWIYQCGCDRSIIRKNY